MVHRSPRSGVSPVRALSRGENRRDRDWDRMRPFWAPVVCPTRREPGSRQPEQYALDPGLSQIPGQGKPEASLLPSKVARHGGSDHHISDAEAPGRSPRRHPSRMEPGFAEVTVPKWFLAYNHLRTCIRSRRATPRQQTCGPMSGNARRRTGSGRPRGASYAEEAGWEARSTPSLMSDYEPYEFVPSWDR
jgi:hypothetical protein